MPDRIEPCLALLKAKPPPGPDWIYEIKWDGYRVAVHIRPNSVRIITRGGHDWTDRFPAIAAAARSLGVGTAILDGEAAVLDGQSRSDFGAMQRSLGGRGGRKASGEAASMPSISCTLTARLDRDGALWAAAPAGRSNRRK